MGVSYFPKELRNNPHSYAPYELLTRPEAHSNIHRWACNVGNLVFKGIHDHGGHFAAHEEPEKLAGDLRQMFGKGGPAFSVVPDKSGYD